MTREKPIEAKKKHIIYQEEFRRQAAETVIQQWQDAGQIARELANAV
jgi:hypothetical protein